MWKTAFKKFEVTWSALSIPYDFKFFKGCLPQISFGPFLDTLSRMLLILKIHINYIIKIEASSLLNIYYIPHKLE